MHYYYVLFGEIREIARIFSFSQNLKFLFKEKFYWDDWYYRYGYSLWQKIPSFWRKGRIQFFSIQFDDEHYNIKSIIDWFTTKCDTYIDTCGCTSKFVQSRKCIHCTRYGAGNNWASGDCQGQYNVDTVLDMMDRESDNSDLLEDFVLCHSIAGGTGRGMGSFLLEQLSDTFPKKLIYTQRVFPNWESSSQSNVTVNHVNSLVATIIAVPTHYHSPLSWL